MYGAPGNGNCSVSSPRDLSHSLSKALLNCAARLITGSLDAQALMVPGSNSIKIPSPLFSEAGSQRRSFARGARALLLLVSIGSPPRLLVRAVKRVKPTKAWTSRRRLTSRTRLIA